MPFLCPHVTCQLSRVRLCQAPSSLTPTHNRPLSPASIQPSIGHSAQPHSRPPCLPFLVTLHATLPQEACHSPSQSAFHIQLLNATLSQDGALCLLSLLSLLSLLATCLLILTPRRTLAYPHSLCLCISLTHVVLFSCNKMTPPIIFLSFFPSIRV